MLSLFEKASSLILANIKMDMLDEIDQVEVKKITFLASCFLFFPMVITKNMLCTI
jgi:hypothetical protein